MSIDLLISTRAGYLFMTVNLNIIIHFFQDDISDYLFAKLQDFQVIECLDHSRSGQHWALTDDNVIEYVRRSRFLIPSQLRWVRLDRPLLTTMIERWRSETSIFHLREREMTVTLQDVVVLQGLRIDGPPVTGTDKRIWADECERLLDVMPPPSRLYRMDN